MLKKLDLMNVEKVWHSHTVLNSLNSSVEFYID